MRLIEKVDQLSNLISPRRDINLPIYNWHAFKHSYSKELVDTIINDFGLAKGSWVLDPFCGGGITLLACKDAGINAEGYDILPFSVFLSKVKTTDFDLSDIIEQSLKLKSVDFYRDTQLFDIDIPLLNKAFSQEHIGLIFNIKKHIENIKKESTRDFFKLALFSILESASNTAKAGGFLRIVTKEITRENIVELFLARAAQMMDDVEKTSIDNQEASSEVYTGLCDARKVQTKRKFEAVITSPPYPNRHDYTRIYSLELIFGDINSNDKLKNLRYNTLRSHVEAKDMHFISDYKKPSSLIQLISEVKANGVNNIQVVAMLYGYFEDMYLTMLRMKENLKPGGKVAIVVSNVRFSGVNIPVDEILGEIALNIGFENVNILIARYRGNSAQQMKTYDRSPSRESIVTFEKPYA